MTFRSKVNVRLRAVNKKLNQLRQPLSVLNTFFYQPILFGCLQSFFFTCTPFVNKKLDQLSQGNRAERIPIKDDIVADNGVQI